jgi:hypothetical protein
MSRKRSRKTADTQDPIGVPEIDALATVSVCTIENYIKAASAYVRASGTLASGPKKAAQIRLSNALARSLADELVGQLPALEGKLVTQEQKVAGGLRTTNADVSESHPLDGLRLAVELKPINLAVGRAIWNRFGDIRTFAVNIHLKFPFAVVGGVLVIPTYEETGTRAAIKAEAEEEAEAERPGQDVEVNEGQAPESPSPGRKSTLHLIAKAVDRLIRAGGRVSEAEAAHLLEGIAVVVYDPDTGAINQDLPKAGSGLRWDEFVSDLVTARKARFED